MPYQLTYISKTALKIQETDIHNILESSEINNRKSGITGCLLFKSPYFIQILEGNKEEVLKSYERIKQDRRHSDIQILNQHVSKKRTFEGCCMAFSDVEKDIRWRQENLLKAKIELLSKSGTSHFDTIPFWGNVGQLLEKNRLFTDIN